MYEEAIGSVTTVRDFSLVFDSYAKMEEDVLSAYMQQVASDDANENDIDEIDVELRLARFERLMDRRPFLVNEVLLVIIIGYFYSAKTLKT